MNELLLPTVGRQFLGGKAGSLRFLPELLEDGRWQTTLKSLSPCSIHDRDVPFGAVQEVQIVGMLYPFLNRPDNFAALDQSIGVNHFQSHTHSASSLLLFFRVFFPSGVSLGCCGLGLALFRNRHQYHSVITPNSLAGCPVHCFPQTLSMYGQYVVKSADERSTVSSISNRRCRIQARLGGGGLRRESNRLTPLGLSWGFGRVVVFRRCPGHLQPWPWLIH